MADVRPGEERPSGSALPLKNAEGARAERLRVIQAVTTLMSTASLPWNEIDDDALVPYGNGYSCWFVSKEQVGDNTFGTGPLSDNEILERVERHLAAREARAHLTETRRRDGQARPHLPTQRRRKEGAGRPAERQHGDGGEVQ